MTNWAHQDRGKESIRMLRAGGARSIIAAAPCGSGKSRIMAQLCQEEVQNGGTVKIYLHRSMLREQLSNVFNEQGIEHGVQVAGYETDFDKPIQICMTDSVYSRAVHKGEWDIGTPSLVVFDEAHNQVEGKARAIVFGGTSGMVAMKGHYETGATILGFSATPVNCGLFYERLVTFATYKECRDVSAHLPVRVYSPSEIDCTGLSKNTDGEFSSAKVQERATHIIGDAYDHWKKLNPDARPALLFAPSLEGSKWFAEQWAVHGVPVAHLDGRECLLPVRSSTGSISLERYDTTPEIRQQILEMSKSGEIKVLMNRFVLREAIDMPWIYHGIGATVFGGIATYLQSVGRIQRYTSDYEFKIWQDHGGCLDSKTQILTKRGWLSQGEVVVGDEVAAFNLETNGIEWKTAKSTYVREVNENDTMHVIKSRCLDVRVTGNHKALIRQRTCDKNDKPHWPSGFKKFRFDEIVGKGRMQLPISGMSENKGLDCPDHVIRFLGWWITDGTINRTNVSISQKESYTEHIADIREVLSLCGFDWKETRSTYHNRFGKIETMIKFNVPKGTCKSKPRSGWFAIERFLDKGIHPDLDSMDSRQFGIFLHALHLGDGSKDRKSECYKIACGHVRMADTLQSMAIRRGWKCNITPAKGAKCMTINIQRKSFATFHGVGLGKDGQAALTLEKPIQGECVWCVENDLGTLVTRRNGSVAIVGNSYWRHGSPNMERKWSLGDTNISIARERLESIKSAEAPEQLEGICCPKCNGWRIRGLRCPMCGHSHKQSVRPVRMVDGTLKLQRGVVNKVKKKKSLTADKIWLGVLFQASANKQPISSAVSMWSARCYQNGIQADVKALSHRPPENGSVEWHQSVASVFPWTKKKAKAKK